MLRASLRSLLWGRPDTRVEDAAFNNDVLDIAGARALSAFGKTKEKEGKVNTEECHVRLLLDLLLSPWACEGNLMP